MLLMQAQAAEVGASLLAQTANLACRHGRCCTAMLSQACNTFVRSVACPK